MTILLFRYERIPKKDDIPFFSTLTIVRTLSCRGEKLKNKLEIAEEVYWISNASVTSFEANVSHWSSEKEDSRQPYSFVGS